MQKCSQCKIEYPKELLNPLMSSRGYWDSLCGICALKLTNEIHGIERTKFDGPLAEKSRQKAIKWREEHEESK